MHFDFRTFFKAAYLSLFRRNSATPLTRKRIVFLLLFFTLYPLGQLFNKLCLLLDDLLFPGYRKVQLTSPVFIIGSFRSGTTLIHRVLARDENHFFYFQTWEIFCPAIIQKYAVSLLGRLDTLAGGHVGKLIHTVEQKAFRNFNRMHPVGLTLPEEDEMLLIHIFSSFVYLHWFFPFDELFWTMRFDQKARPRDREKVMTFYRDCVKRQAYFKGHKGQFLSKNPAFCSKVDSLYEYFPDCKIIYMVRNPLDVFSSLHSVAQSQWQGLTGLATEYPFADRLYDSMRYNYLYPLERLDRAPQKSYTLVNYEHLTGQPSRVIKEIYSRFGFELSPKYAMILQEEDERTRAYTSRHQHSLAETDRSREDIVTDFKYIFEKFGFDTRAPQKDATVSG